jgi:4a-hydroxytetrahydrobiopterin dehydratase
MTLEPVAVDGQLATLGLGWQRDGDTLVKTVTLATFPKAIAYVGQVAELAEAADHHPDIEIRWRTVTLRLTTHSAGGLTAKDLALAQSIDGLR